MNLGPSNLRGSHWQKKAKEAAGSGKRKSAKRSHGAPSAHKNDMGDLIRELRERGTRCPYCLDGLDSSETWWKTPAELEDHLVAVHGFAVHHVKGLPKDQPKLTIKKRKKSKKARSRDLHRVEFERRKFKTIDLKCHYCVVGSVGENLVWKGVYDLQKHLVADHSQLPKKAELLAFSEARRQYELLSRSDAAVATEGGN